MTLKLMSAMPFKLEIVVNNVAETSYFRAFHPAFNKFQRFLNSEDTPDTMVLTYLDDTPILNHPFDDALVVEASNTMDNYERSLHHWLKLNLNRLPDMLYLKHFDGRVFGFNTIIDVPLLTPPEFRNCEVVDTYKITYRVTEGDGEVRYIKKTLPSDTTLSDAVCAYHNRQRMGREGVTLWVNCSYGWVAVIDPTQQDDLSYSNETLTELVAACLSQSGVVALFKNAKTNQKLVLN